MVGKLRLCDVKGDGHCYYRCIYNVIKEDDKASDSLYIENINQEDETIMEIREYVGVTLKCSKIYKDMLRNLLNIYEKTPSILGDYPLLGKFDMKDSFENICDKVIKAIENTNMMASSFEHEIISARLSVKDINLKVLIITKNENEKWDDIIDKWLRQFYTILKTVYNTRIAILINEDNIHYKYIKFMGKTIFEKKEFEKYIDEILNDETSEESD